MISINKHSSIKITSERYGNIYFDPYQIRNDIHDADVIFITHNHYDHFSLDDIRKVVKRDTKFVCANSCLESLISVGINSDRITTFSPNEKGTVIAKNGQIIEVSATPAYNIGRIYHPKENNWIGYLVKLDDKDGNPCTYFVPGDTDMTEDILNVRCDVCFVPIGGTYTMNAEEAAKYVNTIRPKLAIPMHYGMVAGADVKGVDFAKLVDEDIDVSILVR